MRDSSVIRRELSEILNTISTWRSKSKRDQYQAEVIARVKEIQGATKALRQELSSALPKGSFQNPRVGSIQETIQKNNEVIRRAMRIYSDGSPKDHQ